MASSRWVLLIAVLAASCLLAIAIGTISIPLSTIADVLRGGGDGTEAMVVRALRMPRTALAVLVGAGLGMSGAALQGSLRNPLAEPYLLGVSGGAAVGAVIATLSGAPSGIVPLAAFVGALAAVAAAFLVARVAGSRGDARVLLMAGVVVGAFANAAIMVMLANAQENTVRNALWWMMGSVSDATRSQILVLLAYVVVAQIGVMTVGIGLLEPLALAGTAIFLVGDGLVKATLLRAPWS